MSPKIKKTIADVVIIILLLGGIGWIASLFIHVGKEYTNNAQIHQDIVAVSCRVQGFVKKVYYEEFQYVKKGDTLVVIEDSEFRLRVAQAEADFKNAQVAKTALHTTISTTANNLAVTDAGMEEVKIQVRDAETNFKRYANLLEKRAVTRQQYDAVKTAYEALTAKLETMQRQKRTTGLIKDEQTLRLEQQEAGIAVCQAALELARLNLSYTVILAPCDGYAARKRVQEGELLMPGQPVASVVSDGMPWVIANYRETQLEHIAIGSAATVTVDAIPNHTFKGTVYAISDATGAQYSYVQPDNATGNFVKTAQRIPVKIVFDTEDNAAALKKLSAGMNAECKINYR